jgi:hypothetical protein
MDQARRERLRELVRILEPVQEEIHDIWLDEEGAFDRRSAPSKETESGQISIEAIDCLEGAVSDIESAITNLREAVGDDSPS